MKIYSIQQVSKMLGIHRNTLISWEESGKIPKAPRNPKNNYRVYTKKDIIEIAKMTGIEFLNKDGGM